MTELQAMPMFWSTFFADTEHMTEEAAKAHLFLLGHAWLRGARLPDDDGMLARLCRIGPRKWAAIKTSVLALWQKDDGGFWTQKRMSKEFDFVRRRVEANRENGSRGGRPKYDIKSNEINETIKPNGSPEITQINPPTPTPTEEGKKERNLKVSCPKPVRTRVGYSDEFEVFWTSYPTDANMSKKEAWGEWQKLTNEDRATATSSISAFKAWISGQKDYRTVHACRYLSQKRFEGHAQTAVKTGAQTFVRIGSEQWKAWESSYLADRGQRPPVNKEGTGWWFATEWPKERELA